MRHRCTLLSPSLLSPPPPCSLTHHRNTISCLCVARTPRQDCLISGSFDNTIAVWDVTRQRSFNPVPEYSLIVSEEEVLCAAYHTARGMIFTGGNDTLIGMWSLEGRTREGTFRGHENAVGCLAIDGNFLISGSDDTTILVWDIHLQYALVKLSGQHSLAVRDLLVVAPYGFIISAGFDGKVVVWNYQLDSGVASAATGGLSGLGKAVKVFHHLDKRFRCLLYDAPQRKVFAGTEESRIMFFILPDELFPDAALKRARDMRRAEEVVQQQRRVEEMRVTREAEELAAAIAAAEAESDDENAEDAARYKLMMAQGLTGGSGQPRHTSASISRPHTNGEGEIIDPAAMQPAAGSDQFPSAPPPAPSTPQSTTLAPPARHSSGRHSRTKSQSHSTTSSTASLHSSASGSGSSSALSMRPREVQVDYSVLVAELLVRSAEIQVLLSTVAPMPTRPLPYQTAEGGSLAKLKGASSANAAANARKSQQQSQQHGQGAASSAVTALKRAAGSAAAAAAATAAGITLTLGTPGGGSNGNSNRASITPSTPNSNSSTIMTMPAPRRAGSIDYGGTLVGQLSGGGSGSGSGGTTPGFASPIPGATLTSPSPRNGSGIQSFHASRRSTLARQSLANAVLGVKLGDIITAVRSPLVGGAPSYLNPNHSGDSSTPHSSRASMVLHPSASTIDGEQAAAVAAVAVAKARRKTALNVAAAIAAATAANGGIGGATASVAPSPLASAQSSPGGLANSARSGLRVSFTRRLSRPSSVSSNESTPTLAPTLQPFSSLTLGGTLSSGMGDLQFPGSPMNSSRGLTTETIDEVARTQTPSMDEV
jgi:hypothetical protein